MVVFGGGEHLLWRAVNIESCRLGVVSRVQLTVTVAVTAAAHFLSVYHTKVNVPCVWGRIHRSSEFVCAQVCVCQLSLRLCVYKVLLSKTACGVLFFCLCTRVSTEYAADARTCLSLRAFVCVRLFPRV